MRSLFFAVLASVAVSYASAVPALAAGHEIAITAHNFAFSPAIVDLEQGTTYTLHLKSTDGTHGLDVPALGLHDVLVTPSERTVTITPTTAGTFVAHCTQYCGVGHANMAMKFVVAPHGASAAKPADAAPMKPSKPGNPCAAPPS